MCISKVCSVFNVPTMLGALDLVSSFIRRRVLMGCRVTWIMAAAFGNVYPVSWFGDTGENKKSDADKMQEVYRKESSEGIMTL